MSDDTSQVAVAETLAAAGSEPDATKASGPRLRSGRRSILPVGTEIGRYVLAERIGAGGMGNVYRARDPKLDREIAVKLVATSDVTAAQEYLEREAQAMAKLSHPNVATVHDIGSWNDQLFIAMELCAGGSLAAWLATSHPWREVVRRFVAAGRGLAAAHRIGLVHRDFKPDNVLLAADGTVKVSDFGLVRSSTSVPSTDSNPDAPGGPTRLDRIEGTPAYMAPEQLAGGEVDARADQFAFAVSVWEGVCGGRPFQPDVGTRDLIEGMLRAIRARRLMRSTTSQVPSRVITILERALAADPAERWPSVDALVDALERAARPSRWRWVALGVAGVAVVGTVTAVVVNALEPERDLTGTRDTIERGAAHLYVAIGDRARALAIAKNDLAPDPVYMAYAAEAYQHALRITGDNELRPRLAHALKNSDRCTEAVKQLDTYLNEHGKAATTEHIDVVVMRPGKDHTPDPLDREMLLQMKEDCEATYHFPTELEGLEQLADRYWRNGDDDEAIRTLERAWAKWKQPYLLKREADILRTAGRCDDARKLYDEYLEAEKNLTPVWIEKIREEAASCRPID